jgi:hypothetical protein
MRGDERRKKERGDRLALDTRRRLFFCVLSGPFGDTASASAAINGTARRHLVSPLMSGVTIYTFELPTTGSLSFADHFSNGSDVYTSQISDATQARANLRAVLKESRHTDGDKDYLRLVKARLIPEPR